MSTASRRASSKEAVPFAKELLGQVVKFGLVGLGNTLLSLMAFELLTQLGLPGAAASAVAFAVGAVNGYWWNHRWTFVAADSAAARARYLVVQVGGLALTTGLFWLIDHGASATVAYLVTIATVTSISFVANRRWTFRVASRQDVEDRPPASTYS
jgi:putative flippase GtrA